jgi:ATP phosphoribosyltransferase
MCLKIAVPNKGRLQQPTLNFIQSLGIRPLMGEDRALIVPTNWEDVQLVLVRTEDIPSIVEAGAADIGITGYDYVVEARARVATLAHLDFGKAKIVFAVPQDWSVSSVEDIRGEIRIATKYVNLAQDYVNRKGLNAKIVKISGAAEAMPSLGAADAIIDVMSTGTTLRLHGLKAIDTVLETQAVVVAREDWLSSPEAETINMIITLVKGTLAARNKKMLFMNVPDDRLNDVLSVLPAMKSPTVTRLAKENAWEVITVVDESELARVIFSAKSKGASDIVVVDIEKVIR